MAYFNGLVQEKRNSIANALELHLSINLISQNQVNKHTFCYDMTGHMSTRIYVRVLFIQTYIHVVPC